VFRSTRASYGDAMDAGEAVNLLMSPEGRDDPYPLYAAIREHAPLLKVQNGLYVATGFDVIGDILRDPRMLVTDVEYHQATQPEMDFGPAEYSIGRSMLEANPPDHGRMRRLVSGAFTPRRVAAMHETVTALATTLLDFVAYLARSEPVVDLMTEFAYRLPIRVICTMLGVPTGDQDWFRDRAAAMTVMLEPMFSAEEHAEAERASRDLRAYFMGLVSERRADPRDDLTSALVHIHDTDGATLSGDELLANLSLLLVAGFETTTNLIGNGLVALLGNPDAADRLRAAPGLGESYVEEVLRYDSPVQLTTRWSPDPTVYSGVKVESGSEVLILLGAGNRDPARFDRPDQFIPAREPQGSLSFGAGAHFCVGAALARLEARVALPLLLRHFPEMALAGPPVRRDRLTLRGYASLPVTSLTASTA
jgi:cytochrome P450